MKIPDVSLDALGTRLRTDAFVHRDACLGKAIATCACVAVGAALIPMVMIKAKRVCCAKRARCARDGMSTEAWLSGKDESVGPWHHDHHHCHHMHHWHREHRGKACRYHAEQDHTERAPEGFELVSGAGGSRALYKVTSNGAQPTVTYVSCADEWGVGEAFVPGNVTIGEKNYEVTAIGSCAFAERFDLDKVIIGENVASIGRRAFFGCPQLETIVVESDALTEEGVAGCLKSSHVATIEVTDGSLVKRYSRIFTKENCGREVFVIEA